MMMKLKHINHCYYWMLFLTLQKSRLLSVLSFQGVVVKYSALLTTRCRQQQTSLFTTNTLLSSSDQDERYLQHAVNIAKNGLGHTFPNPAVGCVIVDNNQQKIIGEGFHPRAGYPHAEIFALLQAAKHINISGVDAALSVVQNTQSEQIEQLNIKYKTKDGPEELFYNCLKTISDDITAYVTLEPCCHYGQTPPCAAALQLAGVNRVVVGFRDPNPKVDGGGVKLLQDAGITVTVYNNKDCKNLVTNFVKRITPKESVIDITGKMKRQLRSLAGTYQSKGTISTISWGGATVSVDDNDEVQIRQQLETIELKAEWMEHLDHILWQHELVLVRLNKVVDKKKYAKILGERIANVLQGHVVQTKGHTVLLYRPGLPPSLDLENLLVKGDQ